MAGLTTKIIKVLQARKFLRGDMTENLGLIVRNYTYEHEPECVKKSIVHLIKEGMGSVNHGPDLCPLPDRTTPEQYAQYKIRSEAEEPYRYISEWSAGKRSYLTYVFTFDMKPLLVVSTKKLSTVVGGDRIVSKTVWTEGDGLPSSGAWNPYEGDRPLHPLHD